MSKYESLMKKKVLNGNVIGIEITDKKESSINDKFDLKFARYL